VRTLLLAGYVIETNRRQPTHTELHCYTHLLGSQVKLLIAITGEDEFPPNAIPHIKSAASRGGRTLVTVATLPGENQLGWVDFLDALGGPVPSWRALSNSYLVDLDTAASNVQPADFEGEAWRLFEDLVADGLEFCFGRRVRRLGARKRGQRVSDMITQIPQGDILVVDAKATGSAFDAAMHQLRPLVEYTKLQRVRQKGHNEVFAALVVAKSFTQSESALTEISKEFTTETGLPVAFLTTEVLRELVASLSSQPSARGSIRWRKLFSGGLVRLRVFLDELEAAQSESY
jgi:hypothetical protein